MRLEVITSPGFVFGLGLLLVNDFYLKQTFANALTGKLSDFTGLFIFALFLSSAFADRARIIHLLVGIAFVFWKSPFADGFIDLWNLYGPMTVERTKDYSDLVALTVLPFSYAYFSLLTATPPALQHRLQQAGVSLVAVTSVFAFGATSSSNDRSVTVPETYKVRESRVDIEGLLLKDAKIKDLLPRRETAVSVDNVNIELDRAPYYFDFKIEEKTCDSTVTSMSIMITEQSDETELAAIHIKFRCDDYSNTENINALNSFYIGHARQLFNRHILNKLTPIVSDDKTPRP